MSIIPKAHYYKLCARCGRHEWVNLKIKTPRRRSYFLCADCFCESEHYDKWMKRYKREAAK